MMNDRERAKSARAMAEGLLEKAADSTYGCRLQLEAYAYSYLSEANLYDRLADEREAKIVWRPENEWLC